MGKPAQFTAQQFIDAIPGSGGIITHIARKVGCEWHTAKRYIDGHESVKRAYDNECQTVLDVAELELIKSVKSGDLSAIKFYLSTKGKSRGYIERQEVTGAGGGPIAVKGYVTVSPDDWPGTTNPAVPTPTVAG